MRQRRWALDPGAVGKGSAIPLANEPHCQNANALCPKTNEEEEILRYLKSQPGAFFSVKEVSRFACGRRRYGSEFEWAAPFLKELLGKELIEANSMNHYRCKSSGSNAKGAKIALAPAIARILGQSGKDFSWVLS
jgi:hypothetical protein